MKLEYPLNEALPSTHHARDRLLAKIFHFRRSSQVASGTRDADFALLYAYGETIPFTTSSKVTDLYMNNSFSYRSAVQRDS